MSTLYSPVAQWRLPGIEEWIMSRLMSHKRPGVQRLKLDSLDPLDPALELMYFGLKGLTREADESLSTYGLGRAHHRILFVILRRDGLTVGELQACLGISAQAVHRPLKKLIDDGCVSVSRDPARHRFKALHMTELGRKIERHASDCERSAMARGLSSTDEAGRQAWAKVMTAVAESS